MSINLKIELKNKYKSFDSNFSQELDGRLIIISGINGSGKTQLMDIIRGYKNNNPNDPISRDIIQNNLPLTETEISHKSFRDYSSIGELTASQVNVVTDTLNRIFEWYSSFLLDQNRQEVSGNRDSAKKAKKLLVEKFGEEKFNNRTITRAELKYAIPRDFVLYQDDIFTNKVGEVFFNYVSLVHNKQAEAGAKGTIVNYASLPPAPWKLFNDLFTKLNFGYKFLDHYERINDEINEQPAIYGIKEDGSIDITQRRYLNDLSDGEKALISLTFAVIATEHIKPKILLLDEYDAPLNPSLTNAFFTILNDFFIEKGIQVIMVTHSSSTLALAPDFATFYEVYKKKDDRPRILEVQRDQYEELSIANKKFYEKIENQEARYSEIEMENIELKNLVKILENKDGSNAKLQIISEGKNIEHIFKAIQIHDKTLLSKIEFVTGAEDTTSKEHLKKAYEIISKFKGDLRALFIWDCDAITIVEPIKETENCKKFCLAKNEENSKIEAGIENLYPENIFTEEVFKSQQKKLLDGSTTISRLDKNKLLEKIKKLDDPSPFVKFSPLLEKITSLL